MNRTTRFAAIGLLCAGTSALAFGETFASIGSDEWIKTYTPSTALFGAVIEQGGASLQPGLPPTGSGVSGVIAFTSGSPQAFTLTYDPIHGATSLMIGSSFELSYPTLTVAEAGGTLDHIGIALSTGTSDEIITISGLSINGVDTTGDSLTTTGQGLFDFAMTPSSDLSGAPFSLSGSINISWTDTTPDPQLSALIVGADAVGVPTPEPATLGLLGSALAGLALLRRKRIV